MTAKYVSLEEVKKHIDFNTWRCYIVWINSLPTLEIDTLQRYNTAKPTDFIDTTPIIYESDKWEYIRYDDLKKLLQSNVI